MKTSIALKLLALGSALTGLSYLAVPEGTRGLASICVNCLEKPEPVAMDLDKFPIPKDLFVHIQDVEVKKSAEDFYRLLTQVEINSLVMQQKANSAYGLKSPLFAVPAPITVASLNFGQSGAPDAGVWSSFLSNPRLNAMFPGSVFHPGTLTKPAQSAGAPAQTFVMGTRPQIFPRKF